MSSGNDEVYDLNEPPAPVLPVGPTAAPPTPVVPQRVAPLGYQAPREARRSLQLQSVEAILPSWKLPALLIGVGIAALYVPLMWNSPGVSTLVVITSYVAVRFGMMIVATLALAYPLNLSFGAGGSYLLRLLAITLVAEGTPVAMVYLVPVCLIIPVALLSSFAITCYLFYKFFELELPENMYAALAYWLPGIACFLLIAKMTTWLAGWFL